MSARTALGFVCLVLGASAAHGQVVVSIGDASALEGNPPSVTRIDFTLTLSAPAPPDASIRFSTASGTATSRNDFVAVTNQLLPIPTGATSFVLPIALVEEFVVEPDETFTLTISDPQNLTIGTAAATGTIVDDDTAAATVSLSIGDASVLEGTSVWESVLRFPITLSAPNSVDVVVHLRADPGTASSSEFFVSPTLVLIPAGGTSAFGDAYVLADDVLEPDETFTMTLFDSINARLDRTTATGTILNDDALERTLSIGDATRYEGNSNVSLSFGLKLSSPAPAGGVSVLASTVAGSATSDVDYRAIANRLITFPQGTTTRVLPVTILGELVVEPDETFTVVLSDPVRANLVDATATGTILDDDTANVVTVGDATVVEGDSPSENVRLRFPLLLSLPSTGNGTTVRVTTHAGSATSGSDFDPFDWYIQLPTGTRETFVEIPIHENTRFEPDETLTVSLSAGFRTTVGEPSTATGTILNDDDDVTVSVTDASIEEGNAAGFLRRLRFALALDRPSSKDVRVVFLPVPGSATPPDDYLDLRLYSSAGVMDHVAIIPAGETTGFAEVGVYQDVEIEPDESFTIELDPEAMQVGTGTATGTILNDDAPGVPALGAGGALLLAAALLAAARRQRASR